MEVYTQTVGDLGESILQWADPENKFRGFTEVSMVDGTLTIFILGQPKLKKKRFTNQKISPLKFPCPLWIFLLSIYYIH